MRKWGTLRKGNSNAVQGDKEVGPEIQLETEIRSQDS